MAGISTLSTSSYHRIKKQYVIPAVDEIFWKYQGTIIDEIRDKVAQVYLAEEMR